MKFKKRAFLMSNSPRFASFAEAVDKLPDGQDYQERELVDVVVQKTEIFAADQESRTPLDLNTSRVLMALGPLIGLDKINVLDFGGASGTHFFIAKQAITHGPAMKWHVLETDQMSSTAKRLEQSGLRFFSNLYDATENMKRIDLIIASGALQFCDDPLGVLRNLLDLSPRFLFITRTPLIRDSEPWYSIQTSRLSENGPGPLPLGFKDRMVSYPISFALESSFQNLISERYLIRFSLDEGVYGENFKSVRSCGYFCELKPGS